MKSSQNKTKNPARLDAEHALAWLDASPSSKKISEISLAKGLFTGRQIDEGHDFLDYVCDTA